MVKTAEKVKAKRPAVIHNLTKIKSLLFLQMRQATNSPMAIAREIATATGCNRDSLYILLQRWARWGLVSCILSTPYAYSLDDEGTRYLSKINDWFFSGYYSRKRKRRVPGYRGKVEDLKREIALASNAVFWWRHYPNHWDSRGEGHKGTVYYLQAPFQKASDFQEVEGSYGRAINTKIKDVLLVVKFESAYKAYNATPKWGFKPTRELGQRIVDAKIGMEWKHE